MANKNTNCINDSTSYYYSKDVNSIPLLTAEEEKAVAEKAFQGDKSARDKLVSANLRYVYKIAKSYIGCGMDYDDLIQEGNIGLIQAAEKFNPSMNARFVTYAQWWIRASLKKAICEKAKGIRFPENWAKKMREDRWNIGSLDTKVGEDEGSTLQDLIEDDSFNPEIQFIRSSTKAELDAALSQLPELYRKVVTARFNLDGNGEMSLREAGEAFGYSRERIRQIEAKALNLLVREMTEGSSLYLQLVA